MPARPMFSAFLEFAHLLLGRRLEAHCASAYGAARGELVVLVLSRKLLCTVLLHACASRLGA